MTFQHDYPLFILCKEAAVNDEGLPTFRDVVALDNPKTAVAVFTDRLEAEQFRNETYPDLQLFEIAAVADFRAFLAVMQASADWVAFDPWRVGKGVHSIRIDELLKQLS
jgi:hypothetical protein